MDFFITLLKGIKSFNVFFINNPEILLLKFIIFDKPLNPLLF